MRQGENRYGNSIVALRASTGKVVWHFQTVHHDLWDYDNASPPALTTVVQTARRVPAVLQATKTGMLFVLHRETGEPLFAVEERRGAEEHRGRRGGVPDPALHRGTPPLSPHRYSADEAWGPTPESRAWCRDQIAAAAQRGDLHAAEPGRARSPCPATSAARTGAGWPWTTARKIAVVPVNRIAAIVQLFLDEGFDGDRLRREDAARGLTDWEYARMQGTPYVMRRRLLIGPTGLPCTPPPFGVPGRGQPRDGAHPVGRSARARCRAEGGGAARARRLGVAEPGRADRDRLRPRLHRRHARSRFPRVRHRDGHASCGRRRCPPAPARRR